MFKSLSDNFQDSLQRLRGEKQITEKHIQTAIGDLRRALLEADVSLASSKNFISKIESQALGQEVLRGIKPYEQFIKIVEDALRDLLSSPQSHKLSQHVLLVGLQGAGKTSSAAKLAFKYQKHKPLLIACDLQRPAAVDQLRILAQQAQIAFLEPSSIGIDINQISNAQLSNKSSYLYKIVDQALLLAKQESYGYLIFDTAGRLQIDKELMQELKDLQNYLHQKTQNQTSTLLVLDSLTGQNATEIALGFQTAIDIDALLFTKLDSDARGGAVLSVVEATARPVLMATVGEKISDLEDFHPDRVARRILGMGDIATLVEKAQEKFESEAQQKLEAELLKGNFNYETFIQAQSMLSQLGSISQILEMFGMGGVFKQMGLNRDSQETMMHQSQDSMRKFKTAISSMSREEKLKPELLDRHHSATSRRKRIAKGSGLTEADLRKLCNDFSRMRELFKKMGPMMQTMQNKANINPLALMQGFSSLSPKAKPAAQAPKGQKPKLKSFRP